MSICTQADTRTDYNIFLGYHLNVARSIKVMFERCRKTFLNVEGNLDLNVSENTSEVLTAAKISVKDSKCHEKKATMSSVQHWHPVVRDQCRCGFLAVHIIPL